MRINFKRRKKMEQTLFVYERRIFVGGCLVYTLVTWGQVSSRNAPLRDRLGRSEKERKNKTEKEGGRKERTDGRKEGRKE